jgi:outer membrane protein
MKQKLLVLSAVFAMLLSTNAQAGEVGIINIEKISKESKAVSDLQSKVSKKQEEFQKEVNKKQTDIESDKKKFDEKRSKLSAEELSKEQTKLQKKLLEFKEFAEKKQAVLKKASADGMEQINKEMKGIVASISKEKGLKVVIPASQTTFFDDSVDITSEVVSRLNKEITKVSVKF